MIAFIHTAGTLVIEDTGRRVFHRFPPPTPPADHRRHLARELIARISADFTAGLFKAFALMGGNAHSPVRPRNATTAAQLSNQKQTRLGRETSAFRNNRAHYGFF